MSSQRLLGKILRILAGKPMLQWVLESVAASASLDDVVLATSNETSDDPVREYADSAGWSLVRGSSDDVRARFLLAAETMGADVLVRICGDSPLMDHRVIDRAVTEFRCGEWDMVTNVLERTFPRGLSVEVYAASWLALVQHLHGSCET
jgi:spore coat polysaccharide biosynthesis protein SpsF